ncbi:MAG: 50S ribosomal protein L32 [Patescibacteria group bacterium]
MRHTHAHTGNRRSHHALKNPNLSACAHCKAPFLSHRACPNCGYYKGKEMVDTMAKENNKAVKAKKSKK